MRYLIVGIIAMLAISSCAPSRDGRVNLNEPVEANAPDEFNPRSVSPRAEARYSIVYEGFQGFAGTNEEWEEPTDVERTGEPGLMMYESEESETENCEVYTEDGRVTE